MAVKICDLKEIQKLVKSRILSVNSIFSWDQYEEISLLQFAIVNSCDELTDLLLENNVDLNISTQCLGTALHVAIKEKKLDVVKKLVSSGADINIMLGFCETLPPLHLAIESSTYDICEFLVKSGADVNLVPYKQQIPIGCCNWSPLNLAILLKDISLIELLLKHNAVIDQGSNELRSSLQLAVSDISSIDILRVLEKFGVTFEIIKDRKYTREFIEVLEQDNIELFKHVIQNYDNFFDLSDYHGVTIAHQVVVYGGKNILQYLLNSGVSVNVVEKNNLSLLDVAIDINIFQPFSNDTEDQSLEIIKIIESHIIKVSAAGLYVSTNNLQAVNSDRFRSFREKCEQEISELKSRKISDTFFNYFDVVGKNVHRLAVGLKHSNFCFNENEILAEFPLYGSILIEKLRKAVERKELLKNATELYNIFHMDLPDLVVRNILYYLNDTDLKCLSQ